MPARFERNNIDTKWNETLGIKNIWVSTPTASNLREKDQFSTKKCGSEHGATSESILRVARGYPVFSIEMGDGGLYSSQIGTGMWCGVHWSV